MKGGGKGAGMKGGKGMRNDHLVNRKMMITRGPYKGYEGLVKEVCCLRWGRHGLHCIMLAPWMRHVQHGYGCTCG